MRMCVFVLLYLSSRRRHTRCALVTGVQTCALPISAGLRLAVTAGRPPNRLSAVHSLRILCTDRLRAYEICRRHGAVQIGSGEGQVLPHIPAGPPLAFPRPLLRPGSLDVGEDRRAARAAVPPGRAPVRVAPAVPRSSRAPEAAGPRAET